MPSREQRYWSKVIKTDGCWGWSGATKSAPGFRYGVLHTGPRGASREELAHRISWVLHNGPIPEGLLVLHHCDNPPCSRPDHLFLGTHEDNARDRDRKGRGAVPPGFAGPRARGADHWMKRRPDLIRRKYGPERVSEIKSLRAAGNTWEGISRQTGVSLAHVWKLAHEP